MRTSTPNQIPASPYPFPFDSSLSPQTTALVVIDMQQDCMHQFSSKTFTRMIFNRRPPQPKKEKTKAVSD